MSGLNDFLADLGFGTSKATNNGKDNIENAKQAYDGLSAPDLTPEQAERAQASSAGPSAMGGIETSPAYNQAQTAQMAALANLASNGGRNAASDANLAQIQQAENANAAGQRGAIMQNMAARGMGGSGASLLAQLSASQNATNNQSAMDLGVRGQEASTALQAGQGAAAIGSNMENQQFGEQAAKAQAADAISRFNAGQNTGISEFNAGAGNQAQQFNSGLQQQRFGDQMGIASGKAGVDMAGANYWTKQADIGAQKAGNILGSGAKLGAAALAAPAAATGGRVPGTAVVHGDSPLNDFVPVNTSPGEVVVPRSLVRLGSSHEIASFVKNPPKIGQAPNPDKEKEAMLAALTKLGRK